MCIFDPKEFDGRLQSYQLSNHTLSDKELKLYAEMVTKIRSRFEVDQRELASINIDDCSQRALEEVKRKVKLNKSLARKLQPVDEFPSWNEFESE